MQKVSSPTAMSSREVQYLIRASLQRVRRVGWALPHVCHRAGTAASVAIALLVCIAQQRSAELANVCEQQHGIGFSS